MPDRLRPFAGFGLGMLPRERVRMERMTYNQSCPMFQHLPLWERIVLAWELERPPFGEA